MGAWDEYYARLNVIGPTRREMALKRSQERIRRKMVDTLACHQVLIDGIEQTIQITHKSRSEFNLKRIASLPGEKLKHGGTVDFSDAKWLITEIDFDDEVYMRGMMKQCNFKLKWIDPGGNLIEKWCVMEDGTKYLVGEKNDPLIVIGDARIAITLPKDKDTIKLDRSVRFLVDDTDVEKPLAYQISKPNRLYNNYNGEGVFRYILAEVNATKDDNFNEMIADYTNWRPPVETDSAHIDSNAELKTIVDTAVIESTEKPNDDKEVWL